MKSSSQNYRMDLVRESVVFQLKLLIDGIRDALLIPVALIATLIGLVRGGPDADREFRKVLKTGRRTERWINLFGNQQPLGSRHPAASMDRILDQVEAVVVEQYQKGKSEADARNAVRDAMRETKPPPEEEAGRPAQ